MENGIATRIGYKRAFKAITLGLGVAYLIIAVIGSPFWLFEFSYADILIVATAMLYVAGYFIGGTAGRFILIKKKPAEIVGIVSGYFIVWVGTFAGSLIGFFTEGVVNASASGALEDYLIKPMLLVSFWGFIPIVIVGVWYGISVKKSGVRSNSLC
jgi:hypothetical protein